MKAGITWAGISLSLKRVMPTMSEISWNVTAITGIGQSKRKPSEWEGVEEGGGEKKETNNA